MYQLTFDWLILVLIVVHRKSTEPCWLWMEQRSHLQPTQRITAYDLHRGPQRICMYKSPELVRKSLFTDNIKYTLSKTYSVYTVYIPDSVQMVIRKLNNNRLYLNPHLRLNPAADCCNEKKQTKKTFEQFGLFGKLLEEFWKAFNSVKLENTRT